MTFITGFLMALADSVPGVSGGTIAYILKRYEELFKHINSIFKLEFNKQAITFLLKLASGWLCGFISAIFVITKVFETHIYQISSLFLGFIIISIFIVTKQELSILNLKNSIFTIIGFLIVLILVFFQNSQLISLTASNLTFTSYIYIFAVGITAISAMLLPGVSGSAVMMIFGVYFLIIDSIHKFLIIDFSQIGVLLALGFGILFGAVGAAKIISHLFETKRSQIVHGIIGLLIGSIIAIIYGPTSLEGQNLSPLSLQTFSFLFFIIGIGLIAFLEFGLSKENT